MKWISVKDRLPEEKDDVLVIDVEGNMGIALRSNKMWIESYRIGFLLETDCLTHWMPLPEKPHE